MMLNEDEIITELHRAEFLYKLEQNSRQYSNHYWQAGYAQALRVVLGLEQSKIIERIKHITDYDNLSKLLER